MREGKAAACRDSRSLLGAQNRALGKRFEERVELALRGYELRGEAVVEKTPEPMRVLQRLGGGRFAACFEKTAQPDYKGVLRGGRAVVFEAKFTAAGRLSQSRVTAEQAERLDAYAAAGAWCFIAAGFGGGAVYRIPWAVWRAMPERFGRRYVTQRDLTSFCVPLDAGGLPLLLAGKAG